MAHPLDDLPALGSVPLDYFTGGRHLNKGHLAALLNRAARESGTRLVHEAIMEPADATLQPGQGPAPIVIGSAVPALHYDQVTDRAYRTFKIPTSYVGEPSLHIHWTKAVDTDESGASVLWRASYRVYPGSGADLAGGAPATIDLPDTYDDAGTTSRIVHRTSNVALVGIVAGYYLSIGVEYVGPSTTLAGGPAVISTDLILRQTINREA